jgi:hypothetical protein
MRPTGLGHAAYKDVPDYSIFCGEWCIGRIYETAADPPICAGSRRCTHQEDEGVGRVAFQFVFAMAAYNLIRMPRLLSTAA